ncbi:MAG: hypothetical protein OXG44_11475 [Gammaproteobacteria bacterium]|nr:hypothetical protein [Gammaproteobacteria bacterium]
MPGRSTAEILEGLTLPAEDRSSSVVGGTQIDVTEAWRDFVATYGQAQDVPRLVRGAQLPIGGDVVITVGLETLLGMEGGGGVAPPVPFRQVITAATTNPVTSPRRTWGQSGAQNEPLEWPKGTSHVRLVRVTARSANAVLVIPWAYTVASFGLEHFFPNGTVDLPSSNANVLRYQIAEYGSDGANDARVVTHVAGGVWRPIAQYPNGWVSGCMLGQTGSAPSVQMMLDFETLAIPEAAGPGRGK